MAISTFGGLNTAFSGTNAAQRQLEITSKNIANSATKGYSRQEVVTSGVPQPTPTKYGDPLAPPGGVSVDAYRRIRDEILDRRYYEQAPQQTDAEARSEFLSQIEMYFNEPTDTIGLRALLDKFFNAFSEASNQPASIPARQGVLDRAAGLVAAIREADYRFTQAQTQIADEMTYQLSEINKATSEIADLGFNIKMAIANGEFPNDLMDQRDLLLDKLASIGNIGVTRYANGDMDVSFGGFAVVTSGAPPTAASATAVDIAGVTSGRYYGLLQLQNTILPSHYNTFNTMVAALISEVNTQHTAGFDLAGVAGTPLLGGTGANDISVAISNPSLLALASTAGSPGLGDNALDLAGLRDKPNTVGGMNLMGAYGSFISTLGTAVQDAKRSVTVQTQLADQVRDRRDTVSAVSLDEEMSNLIRFQTAYQASARAVTAIDELLNTLVNRTGRAGL